MWALQGHTEVEQGWYRREIMISPENMQKNLFLNGNELAAETEIYINGRFVHRKFNTKDLVSLKINQYLRLGRNVLALKLRDSYCDGGYFWGGIRGDISIDLLSQQKPPVNYGQLRSYFWERMLHGESGSVYSYAYVNEGWKRYMYYPANMEWKAFKAFPQIKLEFKNSRDIVPQKKLRLGAKIALCYPEETMRHHIAETFTDASKGPLGHDVLSWYSALISTGVPSAVIPNSHLKTEKLRKYKAIFMQGNERVPTGAMNNLRRYVEQGGILIMDAASLQREDEFDAPIEKAKFAGCKIGAAYSDMADIAGGELDLPMHSTVPRLRDKIVGWETHAEKATLLLADSLKRPVLLGNRVGRGWVYTLTANPNGRALNKIFAKLLAKHQQLPDVSFQADEEVPWVERYLLGDKGKYLLYLHNWGGGTFNGRISLNKPLAPGNYTVRNLETGEALLTNTPVREIMKNGIKATLSSQNPLVLLMENSAPRELERLSDEQHQWLDYIDREPLENIPSAKRVLIYSGGIVTYSRIKLLTATYLLEQNGFECVAGISTPMTKEMEVYNGTLKNENLSSYGIIFIGGNRAAFKAGEIELLEQYVKDGGRLFFCGNWARSFWISNYHNNQLLKLYGADITNYNYIDPQNCDDGVELYPIFNTASNKRLVSHGMALLQVDDNWQITVPGTAHCTGANMVPLAVEKQIKRNFRAAAIATREYGKGKIVVCGDPSWLEGESLKKGDNQEIFLGLMQWLGE